MKVSFTRHAAKRLKTRTNSFSKVSPKDVVRQFEAGNYIRYAKDEIKKDCFHYAFSLDGYSEPFIVVIDEKNNQIITVMNYDKCKFKVPLNIMKLLKNKKEDSLFLESSSPHLTCAQKEFIKKFANCGSYIFEEKISFMQFTAFMIAIFGENFVKSGVRNGKQTEKYTEKTKNIPSFYKKVIYLYFVSQTNKIRVSAVDSMKLDSVRFKTWIEEKKFLQDEEKVFKDLVLFSPVFFFVYLEKNKVYGFDKIVNLLKEKCNIKGYKILKFKNFFSHKVNKEMFIDIVDKRDLKFYNINNFCEYVNALYKNKNMRLLYDFGFLK